MVVMKAFYADSFVLPLPEGHRFPIEKYSRLRQRVQASGLIPGEDLQQAEPATDEQLLRAHYSEYVSKVVHGDLSAKEIRRIGFPWSPELVERSRRSVGGTLAACRAGLVAGTAVNLAGGTHHAYSDHGEGFCVFNDVAVAALAMQAEARANRILIIDCDVHQGNGTAAIFARNERVFTFSIHGAKNFPFHKEPSDLDIALQDGCEDDEYLQMLAAGLETSLVMAKADLVIYIAGADPFRHDRLGRMALSKAGLQERDRMVLKACDNYGLPIAIVMGGGYSPNIDDIVDIHFQTIQLAVERTLHVNRP
jgi:acetoin utilization deacetylase AcuC-like enzyme